MVGCVGCGGCFGFVGGGVGYCCCMRFFGGKRGVVGSAGFGPLGVGGASGVSVVGSAGLGWQRRVLDLVGVVPEASGAGALVENSVDRVVFGVEGSVGRDVFLSGLLEGFPSGRAGLLVWLVGECFPVFRVVDGGVVWEVFSPLEFRPPKGGRGAEVLGSDGRWGPVGGVWFRVHRGSPARRFEAWSVFRSLVDLLEAMFLHQHADTAVAMSRLAGAGVLWWPSALPRLGLRDGVPEAGSQEELQLMLKSAMEQSILDRGKSEAFVPIVVFSDPSDGEGGVPKHVLMERPDDARGYADRFSAYLKRLATGLELPVESVGGVGGANHWTAWVVKEDKWRFYLNPLSELLAEGLERNFLGPVGEKLGLDVSGARVVVDGSALISKPDKTDAGIRMFQLGGISGDAARRATGFDAVGDAPSEGERRDLEAMRRASPRVQELPVEARDTRPLG